MTMGESGGKGDGTGIRRHQAMVSMRDGIRLNTFVFLPEGGEPR